MSPGFGPYPRPPARQRRRSHPGRRGHQSPPSRSILDGNRRPPRRVTSRRTTTLHAPTDISYQEGLDNHPDSGVETQHGPHLGNYVIVHTGADLPRVEDDRAPERLRRQPAGTAAVTPGATTLPGLRRRPGGACRYVTAERVIGRLPGRHLVQGHLRLGSAPDRGFEAGSARLGSQPQRRSSAASGCCMCATGKRCAGSPRGGATSPA